MDDPDFDRLFAAISAELFASLNRSFPQFNSVFDRLESLSDHLQISVPLEMQQPQSLRERMFQPQAIAMAEPINFSAPSAPHSLRQGMLTPDADLTLSAGNAAYFDDAEQKPDIKEKSHSYTTASASSDETMSGVPLSGWKTLWSGMLDDSETRSQPSTTNSFNTSYKYRSTIINGTKTEILEQQDAQGNKEVRTTRSEDGKKHVMVVRTSGDGTVETEETIDGVRISDGQLTQPSIPIAPSTNGWFSWLWDR